MILALSAVKPGENWNKQEDDDPIAMPATQEDEQETNDKLDTKKKKCPFISSFIPVPSQRTSIMSPGGGFEIAGMIGNCIEKECMFFKDGCLLRKGLEN